MRVIAGKYKGRRLECPKGDIIRPTTDKVKEAMFGALHFDIAEATVLDAFAGSGALGIEALSRGAAHVDFVEKNVVCLRALRGNLDVLGDTRHHVYKGDVLGLIPQLGCYDIMLLDPPYDAGLYTDVLEKADVCGILKPGATVVMESRRQFDFTVPMKYNFVKRRDYGDITLWFLKYGEQRD